MSPERYAVIEASTKSGKTHACIQWLLWEAFEHGRDGRNFWWIAPTYNQATIAYNRMHRTLLTAPSFIKANAYEHSIFLDNGAKIRFLSAEKPDGLYGEDCYGAVLDEATRMREEAWVAIRSTLTATRGRARIIGNVKGKKNWAYRLARRAEAGEQGWHYARLTAQDAIDGNVLAEDALCPLTCSKNCMKLSQVTMQETHLGSMRSIHASMRYRRNRRSCLVLTWQNQSTGPALLGWMKIRMSHISIAFKLTGNQPSEELKMP